MRLKICLQLSVAALALMGCETAKTSAVPEFMVRPGYVKLNRPVVKDSEWPFPGRIINPDSQVTEVSGCIGSLQENDVVEIPPKAIKTDKSIGVDQRYEKRNFSAGFAVSLLKVAGVEANINVGHDIFVEASDIFTDELPNATYYSLSAKCNFKPTPNVAELPYVRSAGGARKLSVAVKDNSKGGVALSADEISKILKPIDKAKVDLQAGSDGALIQISEGVYFEALLDGNRLDTDFITCVMHRDCETRVLPGLRFFAYPVTKAPLERGFAPIGLVIPKKYADMDYCRRNPEDGSRCVRQEFLNYGLTQSFLFNVGADSAKAIELMVKNNGTDKSDFFVRKVDPSLINPID